MTVPKLAACEDCRWFSLDRIGDARGYCQRRSPTRSDEGGTSWPRVPREDVCGDWEEKPDYETDDADTEQVAFAHRVVDALSQALPVLINRDPARAVMALDALKLIMGAKGAWEVARCPSDPIESADAQPHTKTRPTEAEKAEAAQGMETGRIRADQGARAATVER